MYVLLLAHAFGKRYELPIPLLLFVLGGAAVVLLSFLLVLRRQVRPDEAAEAGDGALPRAASWPWIELSLLLFAAFTAAGLFGSQEVAENIVPTLFWLIVWIAVPLSCGLVGDWTPRLNPFGQVARLMAGRDSWRQLVLGRRRPLGWPRSLGWWPAALLYFVIACGELIFNNTATVPDITAGGLLAYFILSALFGLFFGAAWLERGEVFSVLFATWGKLGWFRFGAAGRRGFAGGLRGQAFERSLSRTAFVMLLLVSVGFDGLLATPLWNHFVHRLPDALSLGTMGYKLFAVLLFAALCVVFVAIFYGFAAGVAWAGGYAISGGKVLDVLAGLLPSLLPISFGYLLAHNIEYLLANGQLLFPLLGNPIGGDSWPLRLPYPFNDSYEPNPHLLPSAFFWYLSVAVIIAVHVAAVVLAHRHLALATADGDRARRSEYPWIAAMVAYTMLSLWLLAQPLVQEKPTGSTAEIRPLVHRVAVSPGDPLSVRSS